MRIFEIHEIVTQKLKQSGLYDFSYEEASLKCSQTL